MNKAIIFGISDFSAVIYAHIKDTPNSPKISAFIVDKAYRKQDEFCGLPVGDAEDMALKYPASEYGVFLCVGYKNMNQGRCEIFKQLKKKGYTILNYLHPTAQFRATEAGEGNIVMPGVLIDMGSCMGDCNIFFDNSILGHHNYIGSFNYFSYNAVISGRVTVGNCCFFGVNSSVAHNLTLSDKTLVGIGAVATQNTSEGTLIVPPRMVTLKGKSRLAKF